MNSARPTFEKKIGWAVDYAHLFRGTFSEQTDVERVLLVAHVAGRALLVGKGGSGKTTIARQLGEAATRNGQVVCFVNLSRWTLKIEREWELASQKLAARADVLLNALGEPPFSLSKIDEIKANVPKLIIIDGLNEVGSRYAEQIVASADYLARTFIGASVLITDRLIRREAISDRWSLGMVLPLDEGTTRAVIEKAIGDIKWEGISSSQKRLLENPFFLDKTIEQKSVGSNLADTIEGYLSQHAGLSSDESRSAATGAYKMYESTSARSFDVTAMAAIAGTRTVEKLVHSGVIEKDGRRAQFSHHLFHDYYAAKYLSDPTLNWGYEALNTISFNASSFDAVALLLQLLDTKSADEFVRRVYDWNPYAAAYAISDLEGDRVSSDMKFVIAIMLSERVNDIFAKTAERSADALSIMGGDISNGILNASPAEIRNIVSNRAGHHEWFSQWKSIFTELDGIAPRNETLRLLSADDSILGWTVANVIRRQRPNPDQQWYITGLINTSLSAPVRWRSVHVLGAFPSVENKNTLLHRLTDDEDEWVSYGALRSLLEIAARSTSVRAAVITDLETQIGLIESKSRLRDEFARAMFARAEDRADWLKSMAHIIRELASRSEDRTGFERWVVLADQLEEFLAA